MSSRVRSDTTIVHGPAGSAEPGKKDFPESRTLWERIRGSLGSAVGGTATKPLVVIGYNVNPLGHLLSPSTKGPADALGQITRLANKGLQRLKARGVKYDEITGERHAHFNQIGRPPESSLKQPTPAVGAVAKVPGLDKDPEVTRAIPLQTRVKEIKFDVEAKKHLKNLARKASALTALMQMRDSCGIKEKDNLNLLRIVAKATKEGATETLWDLFTSQYDLTLSQKFKAGWCYWAEYQTSLIDNTVEAYLSSFVAELEEGLISEQTLTKIIKHFLLNTNEFFIQDIGATRAFALAMQPDGNVEKYREQAIENHYGNSLEKLCQEFSKKMVNDEYTVPIGRRFHSIPIIKWFCQAIEWFANRFIIRRLMKTSILPSVLKSAVENGVEATAPHNLPFSVHLTRFLNEQMDYLRGSLEEDSPSGEPTPKLPGTENLPEMIKHLKIVLDLEQLKTQPELRRKFLEIDNGKGFVDKLIEDVIQEAIVQASHKLLDHLTKMAQSSELSCKLLELSCAPFSDQAKNQTALRAEFREEQLKLKKGAGDLFKKIIESVVAKKIKGPQAEDAKKAAEAAFKDGKKVADETFDKLRELCEQMRQKIDRSARDASKNSVQTDIATFLQHLMVLANRKELQDRVEGLNPEDRDAIYRQITPFYERIAQLGEKVLRLQDLQDEYPAHEAVVVQLRLVVEILDSIRNQFHAQPRHLRNPLIQTLEKTCEEIGRWLGVNAPATLRLQGYIKSISHLSERIAREQQVIDAIEALAPPRDGQASVKEEGLLEKLLNYERGVDQPGFQRRACLNDIDRYLKFFPEEEQKELRELIDDGSNLSGKWKRIGELLQKIYASHRTNKDRDANHLDGALGMAEKWTREKIEKYSLIKDQDHTEMQKVMRDISTDVTSLHSDAFHAKVELPIYVEMNSVATAAGPLVGAALGVLGGPIGAAVSAALYPVTHNLSRLLDRKPGAWGKAVGTCAAGAAASYVVGPTLVAAAGGALTGLNAVQAVHTNAQDKVLPQVLETFENAYALATRSERLAHAFATRLMKTWIRAKK